MSQNILAIIPARGDSKGVPRKNIKLLLGRPLIYYTIEEAKKSKLITKFIISTDDEEIADISKGLGADVPFLRPKGLAGDFTTDIEYLQHAVDWFKKNEDYLPDIILRLPPTSPLRRAEHIDRGIQMLIDAGDSLDSVRPIVESSKHPYKMWRVEGDLLKPFLDEKSTNMKEPWNMPRQKLPKVYVHTGAMDVLWTRTLEEKKSTSGNRIGYFFMSEEDSVNIDSELDFLLAEAILLKNENLKINN